VVGAELGPQAPDVDIHRAGAAVVVVAPYFGQQLLPREDAAGVLGEVLEQLEFLERQVECRAVDARRLACLIDDDAGSPDLGGGIVLVRHGAGDPEPDAGFHLGRPGGLQQNVVHRPG